MATEHHIIVWIFDDKVYGKLISSGSFFSRVEYECDGIEYDVYLENDEFEIIQDIQIEVEEEC